MVKYLVVCIDRDNDLGRKTGIAGPVVGRDKNLEAATKLLLADPSEADGNAMFAAIQRFDDLKARYGDVELATLTGYGKEGFESDRELSRQIDQLTETLHPEGFVIITNGKEDDEVIPLIQSRGKIISKQTVLVRQAETVESTYFTITNALKDPYIARIVFVIPGLVLLLFAVGQPSLRFLLLIAGAYLIVKGFGVEEKILEWWHEFSSSVSFKRPLTVILYLASVFAATIGIYTAYVNYSIVPSGDWIIDGLSSARSTYVFFLGAGMLFLLGRAIDSLLLRQAHRIRDYFLSLAGTVLFWFELEVATVFFIEGATNYDALFASLAIGLGLALLAFQFSKLLDIRSRVTKLLLGVPVFSPTGEWLGRVVEIDRDKQAVKVKNDSSPVLREFSNIRILRKDGRIVAN